MKPLTITVVYDNYEVDRCLKTAWGYSALVEFKDQTLLFDTGGDGPILLNNMRILGIEPGRIENIVLSHNHLDHTGGLEGFLETGARPMVYVPPSFPARFKRIIGRKTGIIEVTPGQAISADFYTTGEMHNRIEEQSLVIKTSKGLVVVTGCAHPGIVDIVGRVKELLNTSIHLVIGGFHLRSKSMAEMTSIIADLRRFGVEKVAPSHCTGDQSIDRLAVAYGKDYIQSGAGKIIHVEDATG